MRLSGEDLYHNLKPTNIITGTPDHCFLPCRPLRAGFRRWRFVRYYTWGVCGINKKRLDCVSDIIGIK